MSIEIIIAKTMPKTIYSSLVLKLNSVSDNGLSQFHELIKF